MRLYPSGCPRADPASGPAAHRARAGRRTAAHHLRPVRPPARRVEGGLLEVAGEERVRGAVERRYRLHRARAAIDADAAASMSLDDHRHGFAAAVAGLVAEFDAY